MWLGKVLTQRPLEVLFTSLWVSYSTASHGLLDTRPALSRLCVSRPLILTPNRRIVPHCSDILTLSHRDLIINLPLVYGCTRVILGSFDWSLYRPIQAKILKLIFPITRSYLLIILNLISVLSSLVHVCFDFVVGVSLHAAGLLHRLHLQISVHMFWIILLSDILI